MAGTGCNLPNGWSMLSAAPSESAFAGILGGFLFLGIVTLMTEQSHPGGRTQNSSRHCHSSTARNYYERRTVNRERALMLFLPAFLSLLVSSFMFAEVSGEQVCSRAYAEGIFAASFLGIGGLGVFCGICWMLDVYATENRDLRRTSVIFTFISFFVVIALLADSGEDVIEDAFDNRAPWYAIDPLIIYGPLLLISIAAARKYFMPKNGHRTRAQLTAVAFPAAYAVIAVILYSVLTSSPPSAWPSNGLDDWKIYLTVRVALFFPAITMLVYARALPDIKPKMDRAKPRHSKHSASGVTVREASKQTKMVATSPKPALQATRAARLPDLWSRPEQQSGNGVDSHSPGVRQGSGKVVHAV